MMLHILHVQITCGIQIFRLIAFPGARRSGQTADGPTAQGALAMWTSTRDRRVTHGSATSVPGARGQAPAGPGRHKIRVSKDLGNHLPARLSL